MTARVLANEAWEALLSAHAVVVKELAAQGIWRDISMREYDVLYTLAKRGAPLRLGELNRRVLLSQPALSRLVDRLVERGLVARCADPADRRGVRLFLTEEGQARQRELGRRHARDVARIMRARVTTDELAALRTICGKLADGAVSTATEDRARPDAVASARRPRPPRSRAADGTRRKADISA
ncbi:MAG: MarR family transcriptional regulator [Micromonosporaceae bacterium]|nr:MarR family transcriptional regulator [Micromonosporaceae bacterium]